MALVYEYQLKGTGGGGKWIFNTVFSARFAKNLNARLRRLEVSLHFFTDFFYQYVVSQISSHYLKDFFR
jgi:hypothetical protein